ncbi:hypothetical protein DFH11DRAFT_1627174 [Phellopilus nigrolimitatus]|nr:hypothetical protein DFH11DRAFT_1627174 [Phellopilus nigrolimitatus]
MASADPVDIRGTFGSAYIGAMVMMVLYGITCLQTYMFFVRYPKDSAPTKLLVRIGWIHNYGVRLVMHYLLAFRYVQVSLLWLMDTIHVAFGGCCLHAIVMNYANPPALGDGVWSLFVRSTMSIPRKLYLIDLQTSIGMNVLIAFVVQCFFTHKIHSLSQNWWLTVTIVRFGLGVSIIVYFNLIIKITSFQKQWPNCECRVLSGA